ncbi:VaFE repeat-containing surface-anchored protein, partial [Corynebacterium glutamicum]|uniref:VaFE repeat-containing surface-anchored protein n=1 Tax=Corynebacterium glutamicum TaxID=1718 RepID=UPI003C7E48AB
TFTVEKEPVPGVDPSIGTTVKVVGSDVKVLPLSGGTVVDTVEYTGLTVGQKYVLEGQLHTLEGVATGIKATQEFTAESVDGSVDVTFKITGDQVAEYAGEKLVAFEVLFELDGEGNKSDTPVASHEDPEDEAQTFTVEKEPVRGVEVTKTVTGTKGAEVTTDKDAVFQIEASWTDRLGNSQSKIVNVVPGEPVVLNGLPVGTDITLTEVGASTSVNSVKWTDIVWSGQNVVDGEGDSTSATIRLEAGDEPVSVGLENKTGANGLIIIPLPIPIFPGGGSSEDPTPNEPVSPVQPGKPGEPVSPSQPGNPATPGESLSRTQPGKPGEMVTDKGTARTSGLANTGADVAWIAGGAVLLLLAGAWLTLRGRRDTK